MSNTPLVPGNIDLSNRRVLNNADGSISTIETVSFNVDGKEVLVPTIDEQGNRLSEDEAFNLFVKTGKHLGMFSTVEDASLFAQNLSRQQGERYNSHNRYEQLVRAGFTPDEIKADVAHQRDILLQAGFPDAEVYNHLSQRYGLDMAYDSNYEDVFNNLLDNLSTDDKKSQQAMIEQDVARLSLGDRNYTDEELRNPTVWELRDSQVAFADRPLSPSDRQALIRMKENGEIPERERTPVSQKEERYWEQGIPRATNWTPIRYAENATEAFLAGYQNSTTGLIARGALPNLEIDPSSGLPRKVAAAAGQMLGDVPTFTLGAIGAGTASVPTGPGALGGAVAGGSFLTEGTRHLLMDTYANGKATGPVDFFQRLASSGLEATRAGAVGFATGYAGGVAGAASATIKPQFLAPALRPTVEVATMSTLGPITQGHLPSIDDFIVGAATIGTYKLGGFYTSKLRDIYAQTNIEPNSLIQYATRDPSIREDILSNNNPMPRSLGGHYRPVYALSTKQLSQLEAGRNTWLYLSRPMAAEVAEGVNKRNGIQDPLDAKAARISEFSIPHDANVFWIQSNSDPNMARLFRQFSIEQGSSKYSSGSLRDLLDPAREMFQNPTPEFKRFLESGRGLIGSKEDTPLTNVQGIRMMDRVLLFDTREAKANSLLSSGQREFDISARDLESSISVNEYTGPNAFSRINFLYQTLVDKFQHLNQPANIGEVTVPYLSARLFMGLDGLAKSWLLDGRTDFVQMSIEKPAGQYRNITGPSLSSILNSAQNTRATISPEVASIMNQFGVTMRNNSAADNARMISELREIHRASPDKISKDQLNQAIASFEEASRVVNSPQDPLSLFRTFVVARQAQELATQGVETGLNLESVNSIANNRYLNQRFGAAADALYDYQHALLRYQRDAGLISNRTYEQTIRNNPRFIPLNRVVEDEPIKMTAADIIDPFESMIKQTFSVLAAAERNSTRRLIADQFGSLNSREINRNESVVAPLHRIAELEAVREAVDTAPPSIRIDYRVNGRPERAIVPTEIAKTAQLLDPVSANAFSGLMSVAVKGAGIIRAGAVFHPDFAARNIFRDQFSAAINSTSGYRWFYDGLRGLGAITLHESSHGSGRVASVVNSAASKLFPNLDGYYAEWLRSGGSNANLVSIDRTYSQDMLRTLLRSNNVQNSYPFSVAGVQKVASYLNPVNWLKGGYRGLQQFSEWTEEMTRVGEFIRARESGISSAEAAYRSREVTLDFARIGASMKGMNALAAFFNAQVQGADRTVRQFAAHPGITAERIVAGIVLPSILLSMVRNDYKYNAPDSWVAQALNEVPDWQKQAFWIVPSEVAIFRIPKPHEFGIPFSSPAESFIDHIYANSEDKSYLRRLYDEEYFGAVADQFLLNPYTLATSAIPSIITPIAEVTGNRVFHTSAPIIPPSMENQLPETRYTRNTTEISKEISRILSNIDPLMHSNVGQRIISPTAIDHLVQAYGSSLGRDLYRLLDTALQKAGVLEEINKPARSIEELPFIKAFTVKYPSAGAASINEFFERADLYEMRLASAKALFREGRESSIQRAERILQEEDFGRFTSLRRTIGQISNNIKMIHFNPDMDPEEKRYLIDTMYIQMIELSKAGIDIMDNIERASRMLREERIP